VVLNSVIEGTECCRIFCGLLGFDSVTESISFRFAIAIVSKLTLSLGDIHRFFD
jgi:hypothetical protein